ncbi:NADPH-dependent FMN reductase ArsH [Madurella mycetomatis]|uniref:NADPH-dependent FMN reductase ArsH n=1 Tax=Madurella mycetomatis TaxID=100816 RepID=A0A175WAR1_9PEZI|nr:NADPH-dependent FMN reductase ArsH [Madurella mycetomatis]
MASIYRDCCSLINIAPNLRFAYPSMSSDPLPSLYRSLGSRLEPSLAIPLSTDPSGEHRVSPRALDEDFYNPKPGFCAERMDAFRRRRQSGGGGSRFKQSANRDRLVDCREEFVESTIVMRLHFDLSGARFRERKEECINYDK